jgi:hypothetical protein
MDNTKREPQVINKYILEDFCSERDLTFCGSITELERLAEIITEHQNPTVYDPEYMDIDIDDELLDDCIEQLSAERECFQEEN